MISFRCGSNFGVFIAGVGGQEHMWDVRCVWYDYEMCTREIKSFETWNPE